MTYVSFDITELEDGFETRKHFVNEYFLSVIF
jgi:hypothetical protein